MDKICSKCKRKKNISEFNRSVKSKNNIRSYCRSCQKIYAKKYRQSDRGKEMYRKHQQSPEGRVYNIAYQKEYKRSGKQKLAQQRYRATLKGKLADKKHRRTESRKAALIKFYKTDKGKACRARGKANRRTRELELEVVNDLTTQQWKEILNGQRNSCNICIVKFSSIKPAERDHIIPVTKGGGLTKTNVQGLCRSCNARKGNR